MSSGPICADSALVARPAYGDALAQIAKRCREATGEATSARRRFRPMKWPKLWPMGQDRRAEGEPLPPELEEQEAQDRPASGRAVGPGLGRKSDPQQLAAVEASAGLVARAFALAELVPATPATSAVTPALLEMVGRAFIARGRISGRTRGRPNGRASPASC